jgi:hypothetical protein
MRIRAAFVSAGMLAAMTAMAGLAGGCTHAGGNVPVDSPKMMPYQAPDIDDITGIDSSEEESAPATPAPATPEKPAAAAPASNQAQKPHH